MIDDAFVIDAIKHSHNLHPSNYAYAEHAAPIAEAVAKGLYLTSPLGTKIPQERYQRDWRIEDTASTTFLESDVDMAVHQVLPIAAFKDGLDSFEKNVEAQRRWPNRFIIYAGVDPMQGQKAMEELERQVEELHPVGLKLYPHTWVSGEPKGWLMDDPEIAFPFFERAQKLGLKVVAIHKAVPMGPVPLQYYHVEDVDRAALAFPDLIFEVIHTGVAFIEETAWLLARFPNVYGNLETTSTFVGFRPMAFTQAMAGLLAQGGAAVLDRLLWATGSMHPQASLEKFWHEWDFPLEMQEGLGLPSITKDLKKKILGENYARMLGLDIPAMKEKLDQDEFGIKKKQQGKAPPYSSVEFAREAV
jgi:predicted TIM-barrel fold metal-dependent hydrolase